MSAGIDLPTLLRRGLARATESWQPIALAALAAALAWLIAHRLLGHAQPFFAPIAAAIALSTSWIQRARRTIQMVVGVLLGIGIGEGLVAAFGTSTLALGVIVFVTMSAARFTGGGFFGEGMMFANQAAASAILVLTLHRHGTGGERLLDAAVGGAVAFVLGVVLFPAHPLAILATAERSMLRVLADTLDRVATRIATGTAADDEWALRAGQQIHRQLAALAQARATASANVRIAPRRWRLRRAVDGETSRIAQLDLLANAVLGLVRAGSTEVYGAGPAPASLHPQVAALAHTVRELATTRQPWPPGLVAEVNQLVDRATSAATGAAADRETVIATVLRAAADDLARVVEGHAPRIADAPAGAGAGSRVPAATPSTRDWQSS
jgi:uncharacterized membrane protein YgaE (UPF0421/DUF939 family)